MAQELSLNWLDDGTNDSILRDIRNSIDQFLQKFQIRYSCKITRCELEQKCFVETGNNFASGLLLLKLQFTVVNGRTEIRKSIVLKVPNLASDPEALRKLDFFDKECYMYREVLPRMAEFHTDSCFPRCYMISESGILFLENLLDTGFHLRANKQLLDKRHGVAVLTTMAQFHATSIKYLNEFGNGIDDFNHYDLNESPKYSSMLGSMLEIFSKTMATILPAEKSKKIIVHTQNYVNVYEEFRRPNAEGLNVIAHSDPWLNNFLFQYDHKGAIKKIKFLDFQSSIRSSPLYDFLYFCASSLPFKIFYDNQKELIDIYLETLNTELENLQIRLQYSKSEFEIDLKKYLKLALFHIIGVIMPTIRSNALRMHVDDENIRNTFASSEYITDCVNWINYLEEKTDFFLES